MNDLALRALEISAHAGLALGDAHLAAAELAAAKLVRLEPFRDAGHALLMRAQAERGNVAEALRTFERMRVFLREELGACPSPALLALHESFLRSPPPAFPAGAGSSPRWHARPQRRSCARPRRA